MGRKANVIEVGFLWVQCSWVGSLLGRGPTLLPAVRSLDLNSCKAGVLCCKLETAMYRVIGDKAGEALRNRLVQPPHFADEKTEA